MSLARVHDPLSLALVRRLGDAGGPRADHVAAELDNLIAWARTSPRCIKRDTATAGNTGVGLDTLHTFSLPANSLQTDGDYLNVWYGGTFTANDNDKRINAAFGGTGYEAGGALDFDGAIGWTINARIIRLSSTSVRVSHIYVVNQIFADSANAVNTFTASGFVVSRNTDITGLADLNSNATTMAVSAGSAAGAANDVKQNLSIIELCQQ